MGSYIVGTIVALGLVAGLYTAHETSTGNSFFGPVKLTSYSEHQLRELAQEMGAPDQVEAILQLGERPGDLEKTVPVLAKLATTQYELAKNAADASLEEIGAPAAEHIREFVDQRTTRGYQISCSAMRAIGPGCEIYLPELKRLLEDENPLHRKCALYALQGMGKHGKSALEQIIVCVEDPDLNNQCSACRVLEKLGSDAAEAESALLKLQQNGGPSTRGWAAICLGTIGSTNSNVDIADTLTKQMLPRSDGRGTSLIEQERILAGLAYLGPQASQASEMVREKMADPNKFIAGNAAYAFWRITGDAATSMSALRGLLNNPESVDATLLLIGKMGVDGSGLAGDVARKLRSAEPDTRELAVVAIGNMGPAAIKFEPDISERLHDTSPLVRMAARRALKNMTVDGGSNPQTSKSAQSAGKIR